MAPQTNDPRPEQREVVRTVGGIGLTSPQADWFVISTKFKVCGEVGSLLKRRAHKTGDPEVEPFDGGRLAPHRAGETAVERLSRELLRPSARLVPEGNAVLVGGPGAGDARGLARRMQPRASQSTLTKRTPTRCRLRTLALARAIGNGKNINPGLYR
jgi:hypothetical protein